MTGTRPWLKDARYDGAFFFASAVFALSLTLPYFAFGQAVVEPIFGLHVLLLSLPHHFLTWAAIASSGKMRVRPIALWLTLAVSFCALLPLAYGHRINDWLLTAVALLSIWHFYKQQLGILRAYDSVHASRHGTPRDGVPSLRVAVACVSFTPVCYMLSVGEMPVSFSAGDSYQLILPGIPRAVFWAFLVLTAGVCARALKAATWDRKRAGLPSALPQLGLVATGAATMLLPFAYLPLSALPLIIAAASTYHILVYIGFTWLFERTRAQLDGERDVWKRSFASAYIYSFALVGTFYLLPHPFGITLLYLSNVAHYLVDGAIWRRDVNPAMIPVTQHLAL